MPSTSPSPPKPSLHFTENATITSSPTCIKKKDEPRSPGRSSWIIEKKRLRQRAQRWSGGRTFGDELLTARKHIGERLEEGFQLLDGGVRRHRYRDRSPAELHRQVNFAAGVHCPDRWVSEFHFTPLIIIILQLDPSRRIERKVNHWGCEQTMRAPGVWDVVCEILELWKELAQD